MHMSKTFAVEMAWVLVCGLAAGYAAIGAALFHCSGPLRAAVLAFLIPFGWLSITKSIPASEHVFVTDTYARIELEKLGPNAVVYQNSVNGENNRIVELQSQGIHSGPEIDAAKNSLRVALRDQQAASELSGGKHESQTEKALMSDYDGSPEGYQDELDQRIRDRGFSHAVALEVIEKSLSGLSGVLALIAVGGLGVMSETRPVKKPDGSGSRSKPATPSPAATDAQVERESKADKKSRETRASAAIGTVSEQSAEIISPSDMKALEAANKLVVDLMAGTGIGRGGKQIYDLISTRDLAKYAGGKETQTKVMNHLYDWKVAEKQPGTRPAKLLGKYRHSPPAKLVDLE